MFYFSDSDSEESFSSDDDADTPETPRELNTTVFGIPLPDDLAQRAKHTSMVILPDVDYKRFALIFLHFDSEEYPYIGKYRTIREKFTQKHGISDLTFDMYSFGILDKLMEMRISHTRLLCECGDKHYIDDGIRTMLRGLVCSCPEIVDLAIKHRYYKITDVSINIRYLHEDIADRLTDLPIKKLNKYEYHRKDFNMINRIIRHLVRKGKPIKDYILQSYSKSKYGVFALYELSKFINKGSESDALAVLNTGLVPVAHYTYVVTRFGMADTINKFHPGPRAIIPRKKPISYDDWMDIVDFYKTSGGYEQWVALAKLTYVMCPRAHHELMTFSDT